MQDADIVTLVKNAIHNPDEPRHFMQIEAVEAITAKVFDTKIAVAESAFKLKEVAYKIYDPVIYFPREAVKMDLLELSDKTTRCPLKGTTFYFHLKVNGKTLKNAAWSYTTVYGFDERLHMIKNCIAFDESIVTLSKS